MNLLLIIHGIIRGQFMIIRVLFQVFPPPPSPYKMQSKKIFLSILQKNFVFLQSIL